MTRDEATQKVRKLLSLAEGGRGATEEEAATAAGMAARIMAQFGIDAATVADGEESAVRTIEDVAAHVETMTAQAETWRGIVAGAVDVTCRTRCRYVRATVPADPVAGVPGRSGVRVAFMGAGPNAGAAAYLYGSVCNQIERLASLYRGRGRAWLNSYRIGCASACGARMKEAAKAQEQSAREDAAQGALGTGMALLRLDREGKALADAFAAATAGFRKRGAGRASDASGYVQGKADGARVAIGGGTGLGSGAGRVGAGRRSLAA